MSKDEKKKYITLRVKKGDSQGCNRNIIHIKFYRLHESSKPTANGFPFVSFKLDSCISSNFT